MGDEQDMTFKYKTVRCEWQVVIQGVDQCGMSTKDREVLTSWGSYDEALADLPNHGAESQQGIHGRWIPAPYKASPWLGNDYQILEVQYREVTVKEWEE